jgi:uncharacterized membrane-anchored protein
MRGVAAHPSQLGGNMTRTRSLIGGLLVALSAGAWAQDGATKDDRVEAFLNTLNFQSGQIALPEANATLNLTGTFRFLNGVHAEAVLSQLWGNPPGSGAIGMLVPADVPLSDPNSWAVVITYNSDGYVSDDEAASIDYDAMLKEMQQAAIDQNDEREKAGYGRLDIVGWAARPHYEKSTNRIYWAQELKFSGAEENTLNYDIRVLGREGYLSLNAVSNMSALNHIEEQMPKVIAMAEFNQGARYADFNESTDKIAGYGLAALVGGAVAAKTGFFGKIIALLLAAKKLLIPIAIGVGVGIRALYNRAVGKAKPQ